MENTSKNRTREMFGAKIILFIMSVALLMTFFFSVMQLGIYIEKQQYQGMEPYIDEQFNYWGIETETNDEVIQSLPEEVRYAYYILLPGMGNSYESSFFLSNYLESIGINSARSYYPALDQDRLGYLKYNIYSDDGTLLASSEMPASLGSSESQQEVSKDILPADHGDTYLYRTANKWYVYAYPDEPDSYTISDLRAPESGMTDVPDTAYTVEIFVDRLYLESDFYFSQASRHLLLMYNYAQWIPIIIIASIIASLICLRYLLSGMASKRKALPSYLHFLDYVPIEMLLLLGFLVTLFTLDVAEWYSFRSYVPINSATVTRMGIIIGLDVGTLCLIALKKSSRGISHYSISKAIFRMTRTIVENLHAVWKLVLFFVAVTCVELYVVLMFAIEMNEQGTVFGLLVVNAGIVFGGSWLAVKYQRLCELTQKIAEGQLAYPVHESLKKGFFKIPARNISQIRQSIGIAVEEQLKSERFKTELITNVSHDIKTPLTSIVNYTDLLAKHLEEDEKAQEYIEVILRNSQKLKKLTEDVIEAAKLTSGVETPSMNQCDLSELVRQVCGEFEERFEREKIELVLAPLSEKVSLLTDARMAGRVLDNLIGNALKYSMPNSRVYLDMNVTHDSAEIRVRNVSNTPLNIDADELLERFVRADSSRSTEGSGLGLSIADSLMRVMGGKLELSIDADLFTARAIFPRQQEGQEASGLSGAIITG